MRARAAGLFWDAVELLETVVVVAYSIILLPVVWFVVFFPRRKGTR